MAKTKRFINPPELKDERELLSVIEGDDKSEIEIRGKKFRFNLMTGFAQRKITKVMVEEGNDLQVSCKCVAAAWLNGFFSLKFFWWIVWRWFYYVRQYNEQELSEAIALIKKKVPLTEYMINTILLTGMRETMMQMNKNEAFLILRERSGDKDGNSARSDNGSPNP